MVLFGLEEEIVVLIRSGLEELGYCLWSKCLCSKVMIILLGEMTLYMKALSLSIAPHWKPTNVHWFVKGRRWMTLVAKP